jgi:Fe2+ or Zn2+ uptake regulation protein
MTTVRRRHPTSSMDPDEIARRLRDGGHTVGATRTAIVEAVLHRDGAFTAEQLTDALDDVHVATVYRTLALLEEIGVVQHVHVSHGPALFEVAGRTADRRHLVCDDCGDHLTVPSAGFDEAARRLERDHGFVLEGSHFAIVGRCRNCAAEAD